MYKIGDKVETPHGTGLVVGYHETYDIYIVDLKGDFKTQQYKPEHLQPYQSAHEKLIEMGCEYSDRQSGKLHKVYYTENPNDNQKYELVFDKYEHGWVYNLNNEIIVDLTLSRILTQYLEEINETPST